MTSAMLAARIRFLSRPISVFENNSVPRVAATSDRTIQGAAKLEPKSTRTGET